MCLIRVGAKLCRDTGPPGPNLMTPVIKCLLMSGRVESGVLDEGDSAGMLQGSFENRFIDMF